MTGPSQSGGGVPGSRGGSLIGSLIDGRYQIRNVLGEGGMGIVYDAFHVGLERRVAFKTLTGTHRASEEELRRFKREALAASRIGNDHIIDVMDIGELLDGSPYYVMELLDGQDLDKLLEAGPLPLGRAVHVIRQVCDALHDAHLASIVHRDIKPSNVMLVRKKAEPDFVKVLDFGIAKFNDPRATQLTEGGRGLGTPLYMAPEQLKAQPIDARTDVYAVGAVLFQALTGTRPFNGETLHQLGMEICLGPRPDVRVHNPNLPAALAEIVKRTLAVDRAERFSSCEELSAALAPFDQPGLVVASPPPGFTPAPERVLRPGTDPVSVRTAGRTGPRVPKLGIAAGAALVIGAATYFVVVSLMDRTGTPAGEPVGIEGLPASATGVEPSKDQKGAVPSSAPDAAGHAPAAPPVPGITPVSAAPVSPAPATEAAAKEPLPAPVTPHARRAVAARTSARPKSAPVEVEPPTKAAAPPKVEPVPAPPKPSEPSGVGPANEWR